MTLPALPKTVPAGSTDPRVIADSLREVREYLQRVPTVERVVFEGVVDFPLLLSASTARPFYVALTGRPYPDTNETTVEVLGLTFTWETSDNGSQIKVESIDGVAAGDSVTLNGIVVGERS